MEITEFGKQLRKLRLDLGITLAEMASRIGVSSGMLSSVETGRKPAPGDLVDRLASAYDAVAIDRDGFMSLAMRTKNEVKVRLDERPNANELAVTFAQRFDSLSDEKIDALMAVFKQDDVLMGTKKPRKR
ncbi:MAG: helix-turn-helix transcriptional regulator [Burkholderiales bacterium]|nr:helix-turn-helix transcriptional regulator [Burkholderiales bacterium]